MLANRSLGLLTDLYQLTMSAAYWKNGLAEREAVFHLFFRRTPFEGGYAIACGLGDIIDYLRELTFSPDDLEYLGSLCGVDERPLFAAAFLEYLAGMQFECDVDAMPEGTVVFANEPLVRVRGPIWQCQIIETALLNIVNFQTLVATKASRICQAAAGEPILEFGLRRAQGPDGGVSASRAAYVGGCDATSNVLAGKLYGIPVRGTHAHSWVMTFDDELESFEAYARAQPNNCVFLVDTFDTLAGIEKAIEVGERLRRDGHEMVGIRLDSGDLSDLSQQARRLLDEAGFSDAKIVASNDLDEFEIARLKKQGAQINVWGVGTRLATAYDQPALGGVYKLAAIRDQSGNWQYKVKLSEDLIKVSNPGIQQVRRSLDDSGRWLGDTIYDIELGRSDDGGIDLLAPVFRRGNLTYEPPSLVEAQRRAQHQLASLPESLRQPTAETTPHVRLDPQLAARKEALVASCRIPT